MRRLPFLLMTLLFIPTLACDSADEPASESNDEYAEAIPGDDMLSISLAADQKADGIVELGLEGQPSRIREHLDALATRVNKARELVHNTIEWIKTNGTITAGAFGLGTGRCVRWEADGNDARWRLLSCQINKTRKEYSFTLRGAPLGSTNASDFKVVFGGSGTIYPKYQVANRGAGIVGFDFDAIKALIGEGPDGKASMAYRAKGPFRRVVIGLSAFKPVDGDQAWSALYSFGHLVGVGGVFHSAYEGDVLSRDANGDLVEDQDGVAETGRVSLGWLTTGLARMTAVACGGSLDAGNCIGLAQCWDAGQMVTWQDVRPNAEDPIQWEPTVCPGADELVEPIDQPPTDDDLQVPGGSGGDEQPGPPLDPIPEDPDNEADPA